MKKQNNGHSALIQYLIKQNTSGKQNLPSLEQLRQELGVSLSSLREQLEVARIMGFVDIKPKTGTKIKNYSFTPAVLKSASYAVDIDPSLFKAYADLRNHIESSYWVQSVSLLTTADYQRLQELVTQANGKLNGKPISIPHYEHRELHMLLYSRLDNPFVYGILEAYWELYEAKGLNIYTDLSYLKQVWKYHERLVNAIIHGEFELGYKMLTEHRGLLLQRKQRVPSQIFE
ncbi:MAG: FadR family transcriptional regulator [Anaerolineaceae bacterium]|nr:FadR family transcriptional regulator [Anaerolineaceae bacterium]